MYWLELLHRTKYLTDAEFQSIYKDTAALLRLIRSAILTTKKNRLNKPE